MQGVRNSSVAGALICMAFVAGVFVASRPAATTTLSSSLSPSSSSSSQAAVVSQPLPLPPPPPPSSSASSISLSTFLATYPGECDQLLTSPSGQRMSTLDGAVVNSNRAEIAFLLSRASNLRTICETGFNGGSSSWIWLSNPHVQQVYSFDLMEETFKLNAMNVLQKKFPGRLTVTKGDTLVTLPAFVKANPNVRCDLVLVDGGHHGEVPYSDASALRDISTKDTIVLWDDYTTDGKCDYCHEVRAASDKLVAEKKSAIHACFNTCLKHKPECELGHYFCVGRFLY